MLENRTVSILERIVDDRRKDLAKLGPNFGVKVPLRRARRLVGFLEEPGAILEIKRASPSKGKIAPNLDVIAAVNSYAEAGARNISVLTERNHFQGSLADLIAASSARKEISFLRKDFILTEDEVEVSYRAGADAVLLIARMLELPQLLKLAEAARFFGLKPLVEIRDTEDLRKLNAVLSGGPAIAGVNARNLSDFSIDPLLPAAFISDLPCPAVYESGILTGGMAAYARKLGFAGILVGEAAARDPGKACGIVSGFRAAAPDATGSFWKAVARKREAKAKKKPLVKICGLTRPDDASIAADLGADLLGFVFAPSPRSTTADIVRKVAEDMKAKVRDGGKHPLLVGVITETTSGLARTALELAKGGTLDAVQLHGFGENEVAGLGGDSSFGRFVAARVGEPSDLAWYDSLRSGGQPRVLIDSKVEGILGGSGEAVKESLLGAAADRGSLWLSGGLNPSNVGAAISRYAPELVDASSGLEDFPGHKSRALMEKYFKEIDAHVY